ncbi:MAG TPA: TetR family transcriptional regulator [Pseudonocardia sp.]|jgi:AcrR family transcriptional regulator|nr:TetR family transcriptional regulator [Pseudonocardia sp.]
MTDTEVFQRARSPEQKAQRRAAILEAATDLGRMNGVRRVSLGDIAKSVGLTKSNVLRYFETREDIYLQLTAAGYRDWATRVIARLDMLDTVGPPDIAAALAEALAEDALFCDLVSEGPATLEHNVSANGVLAFKGSLYESLDDLAAVLIARQPGLTRDQANQVTVATLMLAAGLWPWCNPPPVLAGLYRTAPEVVRSPMEFVPALRRVLEPMIVGLLHAAH